MDLDAKLDVAGIEPGIGPADAFAALHGALGEEATVLDRYELEARRRRVDVSEITLEERLVLAHEVLRVRGYEVLGAPSGAEVVVSPYDPAWARRFEEWRDRLRRALGEVAVDHMGSTAVVGLAAKPIVDIVVTVADVEDEASYVPPIEALGPRLRSRDPIHRYFRPVSPHQRVVQIHVADANSSWRRDHLLFRDYLRSHPMVAGEYGELKVRLAAEHPGDRVAYTDLKGSFIRAALGAAEAWADHACWTAG
jgi:GrpB-like predicted nucleotidyltransferase (UPF0157 family)